MERQKVLEKTQKLYIEKKEFENSFTGEPQ